MNYLQTTPIVALKSEQNNFHLELLEKYDHPDKFLPKNSDTQKLIAFNGYYALKNAPGAFFAVDTNMIFLKRDINQNKSLSIYVHQISLFISLDGKTSARYDFTGKFENNRLIQNCDNGLQIDLEFARTDGSEGSVATCSGHVALSGKAPFQVSGMTYNNPIPVSLYTGDYFASLDGAPVSAMRIKDNNELFYDNGKNNGHLVPVYTYVYNLNMYYFTFNQYDKTVVNLIMGTASEKGFACNNLSKLVSRSLNTIPCANKPLVEVPNSKSARLAAFDGYYQMAHPHNPLGFVSIQSQYICNHLNCGELYEVTISYSLDGKTSKSYYFDATMAFDGKTLTLPEQNIFMTFTRAYDTAKKSLISLAGKIGDLQFKGHTPIGPVPLSNFGGVPMKNKKCQDTVEILGDTKIKYKGKEIKDFIYVPLMYILAFPAKNPTVVMSFGTDGLHGNVGIVTDYTTETPQISTVQSIL